MCDCEDRTDSLKERDSSRNRRVVLTPIVSEPPGSQRNGQYPAVQSLGIARAQCVRPASAYCRMNSSLSVALMSHSRRSLISLTDSVSVRAGTARMSGSREDPRLDERASSDHDSVDSAPIHLVLILLVGEAVPVAEKRDRRQSLLFACSSKDVGSLLDVGPVRQAGVALLSRTTVQLDDMIDREKVCQRPEVTKRQRGGSLTVMALAPHSEANRGIIL